MQVAQAAVLLVVAVWFCRSFSFDLGMPRSRFVNASSFLTAFGTPTAANACTPVSCTSVDSSTVAPQLETVPVIETLPVMAPGALSNERALEAVVDVLMTFTAPPEEVRITSTTFASDTLMDAPVASAPSESTAVLDDLPEEVAEQGMPLFNAETSTTSLPEVAQMTVLSSQGQDVTANTFLDVEHGSSKLDLTDSMEDDVKEASTEIKRPPPSSFVRSATLET